MLIKIFDCYENSRDISVTGQKESFWAKFWCRVHFPTANYTVVFDKSTMYDTSFSSKNITVYIYIVCVKCLCPTFRQNFSL